MIEKLLKKVYRIVVVGIFTNDTVLFLKHSRQSQVGSPAVIKRVSEQKVGDASSFQSKRQETLLRRFLQNGDQGYYGYIDSRCIHRSWVVVLPKPIAIHKFFQLVLRPSDVFIQYCETAPAARGKNVFTAVLAFIAEKYSDRSV